jgi:hypothetical protein
LILAGFIDFCRAKARRRSRDVQPPSQPQGDRLLSAQLQFLNSFDGAHPRYGGMITDANGNLFGTTYCDN